MADLIIGLVVLSILIMAVEKLRRDKKAGKSLCGGKCSSCPNGCACCHAAQKQNS